jgi:hypothetical protein
VESPCRTLARARSGLLLRCDGIAQKDDIGFGMEAEHTNGFAIRGPVVDTGQLCWKVLRQMSGYTTYRELRVREGRFTKRREQSS